MNRFILIGGCQEQADLPALSKAIFANSKTSVNFLVCLFARNKSLWNLDDLFNENKVFFSSLFPEQNINFICAGEQAFVKQIESADIIYFSGGDSIPLYSALARIGNEWIKKLKTKTIIGTSAGADFLSKHNYDFQQNALDDGLGIIPVKTIVHYGESDGYYAGTDWKNVLEILKNYGEDLPLYPLREGEFIVLEL